MIKVWCEWDMYLPNTFGNYYTIFESKELAIEHLEKVDWTCVGYNTWQEVEEDGLLDITNLSGEGK